MDEEELLEIKRQFYFASYVPFFKNQLNALSLCIDLIKDREATVSVRDGAISTMAQLAIRYDKYYNDFSPKVFLAINLTHRYQFREREICQKIWKDIFPTLIRNLSSFISSKDNPRLFADLFREIIADYARLLELYNEICGLTRVYITEGERNDQYKGIDWVEHAGKPKFPDLQKP